MYCGAEAGSIGVAWEDISLAPRSKALVRDLWKKADAGAFTGRYEATVGPHDA